MPFDPNWPPQNAEVESAPFRNQFNSLKDLIDAQAALIVTQSAQITAQAAQLDAQAAQLAPLFPQLARDGSGVWAVTYAGPPVALWQVWSRCDMVPAWGAASVYPPANFPSSDSALMPFGAQWWQVKICGSDGSNILTPFSNVVSVGAGP